MSKPPKPQDEADRVDDAPEDSLIPRPLEGVRLEEGERGLERNDSTEEAPPGLMVADGGLLKGIVLGKADDFTTEDSGAHHTNVDDNPEAGEYETIYDVRVHLKADEIGLVGESSFVGAALEKRISRPS